MKVRVLIMAMLVAFISFANVQAQQPGKPKHRNKVEFRVKRMADKLNARRFTEREVRSIVSGVS